MNQLASQAVLDFHSRVETQCIERLAESHSSARHLFDRQLRNGMWSSTQGTEEVTSTAICLIGLDRASVRESDLGIDVPRSLAALAEAYRRHEYPGALGLVIWANAVCDGPPIDELLATSGSSLDDSSKLAQRLTTMELAWLVSGLLHELERADSPSSAAAVRSIRDELIDRTRASPLFSHASSSARLTHRLRRNVANFADQIYAVQALALLAIAESDDLALALATSAASRLVELQGPLGQWWWHYHPKTGGVAQGYPVYAVHQYGMAPMALMSVSAADGADHRQALDQSYGWVSNNEVGVDLIDTRMGTIWRDVERTEGASRRVVRHGRSLLGRADNTSGPPPDLKLNRETRPYEWGWCLFAGSIAAGRSKKSHIV